MTELKTRPTTQSVTAFLNRIPDQRKHRDAFALLDLMRKVTRLDPVMWGESIVGFGTYHYKYASGREGDMPLAGFSPRKQNLTLYIMAGFDGHGDLLKKLGKHKTGKACLYVNSLDDVHLPTLRRLVRESFRHMKKSSKA